MLYQSLCTNIWTVVRDFLGESNIHWELELQGSSKICSDYFLYKLIFSLPIQYQLYNWSCVYSVDNHGVSPSTFHNKAADSEESLLIVKTREGSIFGAFASKKWKCQERFTGSGRNFVWSIQNHKLHIYRPTLQNRYFQRSFKGCISCGGMYPALSLQSGFQFGSSYAMGRTYENDKQLGINSDKPAQDFEIMKVELWAPKYE